MEKSGIFSLVNLNERESGAFLDFLRKKGNTSAYDLLKYLSGDDYLKVLDLMAGMLIKIPSRKSMYRDIEHIKLYCYVKERGFTEQSLRSASSVYGKRPSCVRRAVERVSNILEGKTVEIIDNRERGVGFE